MILELAVSNKRVPPFLGPEVVFLCSRRAQTRLVFPAGISRTFNYECHLSSNDAKMVIVQMAINTGVSHVPKRIICIGISLPGLENFAYGSDQSLLDADIILFQPNFGYLISTYQDGLPCCSVGSSRIWKNATSHWQHELATAVQNGKTVFVILNQYREIGVFTGQREYSGTGQKRIGIPQYDIHSSYECLPIELPKVIPKGGDEIRFLNNPIFTSLWKELEDYLVFESYFDKPFGTPLFTTKSPSKTVGCLIRTEDGGHYVILPQILFPESFTVEKEYEESWSEKALQLGKRLEKIIVDIDSELRKDIEAIPIPEWVKDDRFKMPKESELRSVIDSFTHRIEELSQKNTEKVQELSDLQSLKFLLYGTGFPLQESVVEALRLLSYHAEGYNNGELELDQVIISPEGDRFIGETEGKENSQVDITKLRQLLENIQTDAERDEVAEEATGILFGNGYRTTAPGERKIQFTEKCLRSAVKKSVILIQTSDLFRIAQYLHDNQDEDFAAKCREAIKQSEGKIVEFPTPPVAAIET